MCISLLVCYSLADKRQKGPVPVVHDRNQLIRCFYNHKLTKDEISWCVHARWDDDQVQVCVIYHDMILHHQGTYHPGAPELNPDGRLIHIAPKQHQAFYETLSMFYLPHMCSALQMNDRTQVTTAVFFRYHDRCSSCLNRSIRRNYHAQDLRSLVIQCDTNSRIS